MKRDKKVAPIAEGILRDKDVDTPNKTVLLEIENRATENVSPHG